MGSRDFEDWVPPNFDDPEATEHYIPFTGFETYRDPWDRWPDMAFTSLSRSPASTAWLAPSPSRLATASLWLSLLAVPVWLAVAHGWSAGLVVALLSSAAGARVRALNDQVRCAVEVATRGLLEVERLEGERRAAPRGGRDQ